jgi:hypothetical protein
MRDVDLILEDSDTVSSLKVLNLERDDSLSLSGASFVMFAFTFALILHLPTALHLTTSLDFNLTKTLLFAELLLANKKHVDITTPH